MNQHPECCVAAWSMGTVTTDKDYIKAGASNLLARAKSSHAGS
jgi:hypothetical protein